MSYYTIKDFALKVGLSPQAIYQRLDKDLKPFKEIKNGKKVLRAEALQLFGFKDFKETLNKQDSTFSSSLNDSTLETLLKQLEIKDKQIEALTEALKNEQGLHAATAQQLKLLTEHAEPPQGAGEPERDTEPQAEPEAPAEQGTASEPERELTAWQLFKLAWHKTWYN